MFAYAEHTRAAVYMIPVRRVYSFNVMYFVLQLQKNVYKEVHFLYYSCAARSLDNSRYEFWVLTVPLETGSHCHKTLHQKFLPKDGKA